jgi:ribosomal protein L40E
VFTWLPLNYNASSGAFSVDGTSSFTQSYCGVYASFSFRGNKDQHVYGTVEATDWVSFLLQNSAQSLNYCSGMNYILGNGVKDKWSFDTVLPANDNYSFMFLNKNAGAVTIHFQALTSVVTPTMMILHNSITVTSVGFITTAQTSGVTPFGTTTYASSSAPTTALSMPPVTISAHSDYGWLLPVLVVAIAAFVTFMFVTYAWPVIRSGRTEPKVTASRQTKSVAQKADKATEDLFCFNCGAKLRPHSKFCSKCGTDQT